MANKTLTKNIVQAAADLEDIKTAIHEKGVNVPDSTPSSDYGSLIREIQADQTDPTDVVRFDEERNIDLTGERNIILDTNKKLLGKTGNGDPYNLAEMREYFTERAIPLTEVRYGDNLRGKLIVFTNTDKLPVTSASVKELTLRTSVPSESWRIIIPTHVPWPMIQFYYRKQSVQYIYGSGGPGWNMTQLQIPDDDDYIVLTNTLYASADGNWGFDFAIAGEDVTEQQAEIGSGNVHTNINSPDRPTWENAGGKKDLAMLDDLRDEVSNVVRFESNGDVNLTGKGNVIIDKDKKLLGAISNGTQHNLVEMGAYAEPTDITLLDLQPGDNLRGKTIIFTGTDLPMPDNNTLSGTLALKNVLGDPTKPFIIIKPSGPPAPYIYMYPDGITKITIYGSGTWYMTEVQVPDDSDYIVTNINLPETIPGYWGWEYARIGNTINQVELGSGNTHSNVNSADRPTWESASGKKSFAMLDDLSAQGQNLIDTNTEQDISALKTFTTLPRSPHSPTDPGEFANKQYVDDQRPVVLTQTEYDALGPEVQTNNVIYFIK